MFITASKLYDYTQCPHRVWRDVYGPQDEKIKETNPFVQLLWDRGVLHEEKVIKDIGKYLDLREGDFDGRLEKTIEAMKNKAPLIYQGVLRNKNLLGIPDLIKRLPDGNYIPLEIKSGMGFEGMDEETGEEGKPKKHYAVQLCLYIDLLEQLGFEHLNKGIIIDIHHGNNVEYNLSRPVGKKNLTSLWDYYEQAKNNVALLLDNEAQNEPSSSGRCKLCPWYISCKKWVIETEDLTGLFYVGAGKRDVINADLGIQKIRDIIGLDTDQILKRENKDKSFLKGVGKDTLEKIQKRAKVLIRTKKPVLYEHLAFPKVGYELFFDIENDPTQEFVYLHGVYERTQEGGNYRHFLAVEISEKEERKAWKEFWDYVHSLPKGDYAVYYFSPHEKTIYKRMQKQYPEVISEDELEGFFSNPKVIDLYQLVFKHTDWPLSSYSIKDLATYLGFKWRDETPSGALSIQWFNQYLETRAEKDLKRILEYNEDDCKAMMVLKDELNKMQVKQGF
jgi:predicted RecB family nuclease